MKFEFAIKFGELERINSFSIKIRRILNLFVEIRRIWWLSLQQVKGGRHYRNWMKKNYLGTNQFGRQSEATKYLIKI